MSEPIERRVIRLEERVNDHDDRLGDAETNIQALREHAAVMEKGQQEIHARVFQMPTMAEVEGVLSRQMVHVLEKAMDMVPVEQARRSADDSAKSNRLNAWATIALVGVTALFGVAGILIAAVEIAVRLR